MNPYHENHLISPDGTTSEREPLLLTVDAAERRYCVSMSILRNETQKLFKLKNH